MEKYGARDFAKNLWDIARIYAQTKLDPSFQRLGGISFGSGWGLPNGREYISCFLEGSVGNMIIVVNAEQALHHAVATQDQESVEYFKSILDEGYKYLSIDGNNSASYLSAFYNDHEDLKHDFNNDGKKISLSELEEEQRNEIMYNEKIQLRVLEDISVHECCTLFRRWNTQQGLNAQEWRQARITKLSEHIREQGKLCEELFLNLNVKKKTSLHKRVHEEMIATLAYKIWKEYTGSVTKPNLDGMYENKDSFALREQRTIDLILKNARTIAKDVGTLSEKISKGKMQNLFDLIQITCLEESLEIKDHKEFFKWFLERDAYFENEAKNVTTEEAEEKSYEHWTKFYADKRNYEKVRAVFEKALSNDLEQLIKQGVLSKKRDHRNSFDFKDKKSLFVLQGEKTRKNEYIDILEMYRGKYEVDHVQSVASGGSTTISNAELMTRKENRSKGAKSNEPIFPHQEAVVVKE